MPYYLCNYLCIIVIFAWDPSQSNLVPDPLDRISTLWLLTPTRDWHWQEIVVKIIPLSPLFSDSSRAIITSFREFLRGVSSRPSSPHPCCHHCHLQWVFDKETFYHYEPEVWGAESWHLMISSFWLDPGNWLNLCQIIKTHNGKCHATEESWGAFTGLSRPLPSSPGSEAVTRFRLSPPGQLPVPGVPWETRLGQVRREYRK